MAISPEDAERIPKVAFDESLVDGIEAAIDREVRLKTSGDSSNINLYLNDMGFTEVSDGELFELKRRYVDAGWEVEAVPSSDSYRITLSTKRFYWKDDSLSWCRRIVDECETSE